MQRIPSLAANLFDELTGPNAVTVIKSYPGRQCETEWLDFKSGKASEADIPKIWSKALGAFANNEGGVVVWGVDARKDTITGLDTAQAIDPVNDVYWLEAKLIEISRYACDPPISGVQIKSLPLTALGPQGFVVCYIPESPFRPHRSEQANRRFYLRMGDEAKECSVSILRQLFYPQYNARLLVRMSCIPCPRRLRGLTVLPIEPNRDDRKATVEVTIRNIGNASIEHLHIDMKCGDAQLNSFTFNRITNEFDYELIEGAAHWSRILHPRMSLSQRVVAASRTPLSEWSFTALAKDIAPKSATLPSEGLFLSNELREGSRSYFAELQ